MRAPRPEWPEAATERLKVLWAEGLSASQVARQINAEFQTNYSRCAALGKVHRLGLPQRSVDAQRAAAKANRAARYSEPPKPRRVVNKIAMTPSVAPAVPAHVRPAPEPVAERVEAPGTATILTLGRHACRWPIGDPLADDFTLCGRRRDDGATYCAEHARIAYRPADRRASAAELARSLRRYI